MLHPTIPDRAPLAAYLAAVEPGPHRPLSPIAPSAAAEHVPELSPGTAPPFVRIGDGQRKRLRRELLTVFPYCDNCGLSLQNHDHTRPDYAHVIAFADRLACGRCSDTVTALVQLEDPERWGHVEVFCEVAPVVDCEVTQ